mgnify:CR=1 FL=1
MQLTNKLVLVTGATGGIGRAEDCTEVVRVLHAVEDQYERHLVFGDQRHQLVLVEGGHGLLGLFRIADMTVLASLFAVFAAGARKSILHGRKNGLDSDGKSSALRARLAWRIISLAECPIFGNN